MRWLALSLAGPMLWAVMFSLVYGLHGAICAEIPGPEGLGIGARLLLVGAWGLGIAAHLALLWRVPAQGGMTAQALPRAGAWIGLFATVFTLFPVLMATSC
ncbi:hypothetical protein [Pararhodobacter sp. SW119]|uniref:hypothetical protein n=1 Tax=Pararhodobacter sp. SW119 TaxID=2780075 RepID=UPI001ADF2392|nr:hypothetical protein [Pararhodobacter sp. SW119]